MNNWNQTFLSEVNMYIDTHQSNEWQVSIIPYRISVLHVRSACSAADCVADVCRSVWWKSCRMRKCLSPDTIEPTTTMLPHTQACALHTRSNPFLCKKWMKHYGSITVIKGRTMKTTGGRGWRGVLKILQKCWHTLLRQSYYKIDHSDRG